MASAQRRFAALSLDLGPPLSQQRRVAVLVILERTLFSRQILDQSEPAGSIVFECHDVGRFRPDLSWETVLRVLHDRRDDSPLAIPRARPNGLSRIGIVPGLIH